MGIEIERKYLVKNSDWRKLGKPVEYKQGYLVAEGSRTIRVRIAGNQSFITIKGETKGISRAEFEYPIPIADASEIMELCPIPIIEKLRTKILWEGKIWEIDEFRGENEGLILAEIELKSEAEYFQNPPWIGEEVTGDIRYYNSFLSKNPFSKW